MNVIVLDLYIQNKQDIAQTLVYSQVVDQKRSK